MSLLALIHVQILHALHAMMMTVRSKDGSTLYMYLAADEALFQQKVVIFFLFPHENMCGYSLEVARRGTSNEYPQHMLSCRNKGPVVQS